MCPEVIYGMTTVYILVICIEISLNMYDHLRTWRYNAKLLYTNTIYTIIYYYILILLYLHVKNKLLKDLYGNVVIFDILFPSNFFIECRTSLSKCCAQRMTHN